MFVASAVLRKNNFNSPNNPTYFKLLIKFHTAAYYCFFGGYDTTSASFLPELHF